MTNIPCWQLPENRLAVSQYHVSSDYKCVALTDYDRFPEDIDVRGMPSLLPQNVPPHLCPVVDACGEFPRQGCEGCEMATDSPHEAPPTTGILSLYNRGDRVAGTGPVHTVVSIFSPAAMCCWFP